MKATVFGANGRTGLELLLQFLARGHEATAAVRNPDRFDLCYDRLKVTQGDA